MKNIKLTLSGTSHSEKISVKITGLPLGLKVNNDNISDFLSRRKASNSVFSTKRIEDDIPVFTHGVDNGIVVGEIQADIYNNNVRSVDYNNLKLTPRPSHADYVAYKKYGDSVNMSGGGPFSGRLTSLYCIAGGIAKELVNSYGIKINSYISQIGKIKGVSYKDLLPLDEKLFAKKDKTFPLIDDSIKDKMLEEIKSHAENLDSVGGVIETVIYGNTLCLGDNFFDNLESLISSNMFSIPAIKGIEFGAGFSFTEMSGKTANDPFYYDNGTVKTRSNNNGGINGGIANGMPITFGVVVKPTPSISLEQESVNLESKENVKLKIVGRHDSCIVPRAVPVVEAMAYLAIADAIISKKNSEINSALIGEKLSHSYSVDIHTLMKENYSLKELEINEIKEYLDNCNLDYINVTIPYKKEVIKYLDIIDEHAKNIGAVNTIIFKNGQKIGYNTDYFGFKLLLEKNDIQVKDRSCLILGTGGTYDTVTAVLTDLGAKTIRSVSRSGEINYSNCYFEDVNIIINTTPVGMYPKLEKLDLDLSKFKNLDTVVDCIYNPLKTDLLIQAKGLGVKYVNGLYMLVAQAVCSQSVLKGTDINKFMIDRIYYKLKSKKENIVLIGMPSSGKSSIGEMLSNKLNKTLFDSDLEFTKNFGLPRDYIIEHGESAFRDKETEVLLDLAKNNGVIISTGGGAVLREENMLALQHNSFIIFIERDLNLLSTENRPLSKDLETLKIMSQNRLPLYKKYADLVVDNNGTLDETVGKILKEIL